MKSQLKLCLLSLLITFCMKNAHSPQCVSLWQKGYERRLLDYKQKVSETFSLSRMTLQFPRRDCQCRRLNPAFLSDAEHLRTKIPTVLLLPWIILFLHQKITESHITTPDLTSSCSKRVSGLTSYKVTKPCSPDYELHFATLSCLDEDGNELRVSRTKYPVGANSKSEEIVLRVIRTQYFL